MRLNAQGLHVEDIAAYSNCNRQTVRETIRRNGVISLFFTAILDQCAKVLIKRRGKTR